VTDDIFVAGDVARSPHALFGYQFLSLEHWGNAVAQAEIAAHNMISASSDRRPHLWVPAFWSSQFGVSIKSVGVPSLGEEVLIAQGSLAERRFTGVYGYQGRVIAAVTFDQTKWLEFYQRLIETAAPFPPAFPTVDRRPEGLRPVPAGFPDPSLPTHGPSVTLSGYSPTDRRITFTPARA
jgi:NADPH-dependent 2,4-dienoyl-CoA reductase/sulfur reductase-like enzyme